MQPRPIVRTVTAKIWPGVIALFVASISSQLAWAVDDVAGTLFTLTNSTTAPNGAWSWYEDERAIVDASDPSNPMLLLSSVSAGAFPEGGDIDLLWRNLSTGQQGEFELHDRLQQDDHNSAALYLRPDGRYLAMYSEHGSDSFSRWRISTNPHDPTSWQPEQVLSNGAGTTYNNTYHLPSDNNGAGRTYNFTRTANYDPNVQVSDDDGTTWTNAGKLLTEGGSSDRPYLRYAGDGKKIHFIASDRHPRNFQNSIYHGYIQDGVLYDSDGTVVDNSVFDASGVAPSALTPVFENGSHFGGTTMNRAWTINMEIDNTGNPVGIFSARANDSDLDHRFFYARHDGTEWQVHEMARAGGYLYGSERDYTGLASIDPNNPNVVYMSSELDPRDNSPTNKYELYKGTTADFGESWTWTPITENSTIDNLRPVVPDWNGQNTAVTWLRGNYNSYTNWDTEVVGLAFAAGDPKSLLWRGDATAPTSWDIASTANWDSGGSTTDVYQNGDEVAFDDTASTYQVHLPSAVAPMGVAFNNTTADYTLSGAGITGTGTLRVIGGGKVTLANAANTYSGNTIVASGTLAITGDTTLAGTPHIRVASDGTLDVSDAANNSYALSNQHVVVQGVVEGNLDAYSSTLEGAGQINGTLALHAGSVVQVGDSEIAVEKQHQYIEATHGAGGNTTLSDGSPFVPAGNPHWLLRTGFANDGDFYQGDSGDPNSAPELKTTITGLTPGESYTVHVNYWDASGSSWRIYAGDTPGNLTLFDSPFDNVAGATNGTDPDLLLYDTPPLTAEGNRLMWGGYLGELVANAEGNIEVFIDDTGTNNGDDRTWYDGLTISSDAIYSGEATMAIAGDYNQAAGATLEIDIASSLVHDRLVVAGMASLSGTLKVTLADGAPTPQLGDTFDILDFAAASGSFEVLDLPQLGANHRWDTSQLTVDGSLAIALGLPGDFNGDGIVNLADYTTWRDNLGATEDTATLAGNGTKDGVVDVADYLYWKNNFGNALPLGDSSALATIPEPSAIMLAFIAMLFLRTLCS